jgi:hypothetical protein
MPRLFYHPFVLSLVTLVAIGLWISFYLNSREIGQSSVLVDTFQNQITQQEKAVADLEQQLEQSKNPTKQEAIIRNELLMQKPGEYMIQMPEVEITPTPTASTNSYQTPWQKWQVILGLQKK